VTPCAAIRVGFIRVNHRFSDASCRRSAIDEDSLVLVVPPAVRIGTGEETPEAAGRGHDRKSHRRCLGRDHRAGSMRSGEGARTKQCGRGVRQSRRCRRDIPPRQNHPCDWQAFFANCSASDSSGVDTWRTAMPRDRGMGAAWTGSWGENLLPGPVTRHATRALRLTDGRTTVGSRRPPRGGQGGRALHRSG